MLQIKNVDTYYGGVQALSDVTFEVRKDEIVSIIGANGAGKTTLMKTVMGLVKPRKGEMAFDGERITGMKTSDIVRKGIVYIPEGREVFAGLTVLENLEMGAYSKKYSGQEIKKSWMRYTICFPGLEKEKNRKQDRLAAESSRCWQLEEGL